MAEAGYEFDISGGLFDGDQGIVEYYAHEMAHSRVLGGHPLEWTSQAIGKALEGSGAAGNRQEIRTVAIELATLETLGLALDSRERGRFFHFVGEGFNAEGYYDLGWELDLNAPLRAHRAMQRDIRTGVAKWLGQRQTWRFAVANADLFLEYV